MPDRERGSSGSSSGFGEPASTAEQAPDPTIAEALRLLVKRWADEGEPVLEQEAGFTGRAA